MQSPSLTFLTSSRVGRFLAWFRLRVSRVTWAGVRVKSPFAERELPNSPAFDRRGTRRRAGSACAGCPDKDTPRASTPATRNWNLLWNHATLEAWFKTCAFRGRIRADWRRDEQERRKTRRKSSKTGGKMAPNGGFSRVQSAISPCPQPTALNRNPPVCQRSDRGIPSRWPFLWLLIGTPLRRCSEPMSSYLEQQARSTMDSRRGHQSLFDRISHDWLLTHIPMDQQILRRWLKAGFLEKHAWFATTDGAPQGGTVTPPTVLRIGPTGASVKRERANLVFDSDRVGADLHFSDQ
jgi:hypothetical protein